MEKQSNTQSLPLNEKLSDLIVSLQCQYPTGHELREDLWRLYSTAVSTDEVHMRCSREMVSEFSFMVYFLGELLTELIEYKDE